ncbi:hypothetical protein Spico_1470 [Parasphaerochaeta coccoides DSM 17374]|uniref:Uncharacterized protein n=1 Tax=Parasphaerochaeta coccoides (strain ATCC BAA-1237 / DSM 17374 / SPN1) TaxID=760011 RepID=F4GI75_PARC1|nr:hypothetical protein Spico_1470 [Parasphaerochaeta coccoides DSM 17374]
MYKLRFSKDIAIIDREGLASARITIKNANEHGRFYDVRMRIHGIRDKREKVEGIKTTWIFDIKDVTVKLEGFPRLTTAFVKDWAE